MARNSQQPEPKRLTAATDESNDDVPLVLERKPRHVDSRGRIYLPDMAENSVGDALQVGVHSGNGSVEIEQRCIIIRTHPACGGGDR